MSTNYKCPKCNSRIQIPLEDKIVCMKCGTEMQPISLYSDVIWPSVKDKVRKEFRYTDDELARIEREIVELETHVPTIKAQIISLKVPKIAPRNIYQLKEDLKKLEQEFINQIKERLKLDELREEIRKREIYMATLSRYTKSSISPAEQYKMTVEYLQRRLMEKDDLALKSILSKIKREQREYEAKWKPRTRITQSML